MIAFQTSNPAWIVDAFYTPPPLWYAVMSGICIVEALTALLVCESPRL